MTHRWSRRLARAAAVALLAAQLAGCGVNNATTTAPATGPAAGAAGDREERTQSFGPEFPAQPPAGRPTRVERASLSPDKRILTLEFVGGSGYLASDPCSTDYEPWVAAHGEALDVEIVELSHADQAQLGPNMACAAVGYSWVFHLTLAVPFAGTTINDLGGGGTLLVGPLPGTAHVVVLPPGWKLQAEFQLDAGPPPTWMEIYAGAAVDPRPGEGPGQLVLYQGFGLSPEWTDNRAEKSRERGGVPQPVTFHGAPATVWVDKDSGELLLAWDAGGRSYGLIGNAADMTVTQLVTYAESVAAPGAATARPSP